jgi:hypothetical protein
MHPVYVYISDIHSEVYDLHNHITQRGMSAQVRFGSRGGPVNPPHSQPQIALLQVQDPTVLRAIADLLQRMNKTALVTPIGQPNQQWLRIEDYIRWQGIA